MSTATKSKKKTKVKLQPLGDRVVLSRDEQEQTTAGGIVLPDAAQDKPARGKIEAIGTGRVLDDGSRSEFQVQVGDHVLFGKYSGDAITIDDEEYLLMREDEILAVLG